jgi:hypothetical protein
MAIAGVCVTDRYFTRAPGKVKAVRRNTWAVKPYNVEVAFRSIQRRHGKGGFTATFVVALGGIAALSYQHFFGGPQPRILTRATAARAISATAEFQHRTKIGFELGREEAVFPGACHEFRFAPAHEAAFETALHTGMMQFSPWGDPNRAIPFGSITDPGSFDLATAQMLVDFVGQCTKQDAVKGAGDYELNAGDGLTVEVTGIRPEGEKRIVIFRWYFSRLNDFAKALPRIENQTRNQRSDARLTEHERSIAPSWRGIGKFAPYDSGWRLERLELIQGDWNFHWEYGPNWPDPSFNWHTFDEDKNRPEAIVK